MSEVPEGWRVEPLSELVDARGITYGVVQPGPFVEDGVPLVRVSDFKSDGIRREVLARIDPAIAARYGRSRLSGSEVLITLVGTVGLVAVATDELVGCNVARAVGVVPVSDPLTAQWVALSLQGKTVRRFFADRLNTTVQKTLNLRDVASLRIPFPPAPEMRTITELLGALDDKIESNERVGGDHLSLSRRWFEHLTPETPRARLGSMIDLVKSTVHPGASPDDAFEHFSIPAFDQGPAPTLDYGRDLKSGKTGLPARDVSLLLSKLNPNHAWRCWWAVPSGVGQPVCSPEFVGMTARAVPPEWLFGAIAWDRGFRRDVLSGLAGTTGSRQRVKPSDVAAAEAPVFERSIAAEWLAAARPAFARIERCRVESRRLAAIRDALLPRLVSGRIRVPLTQEPEAALDTVLDVAAETSMRVA
jgi:type I restriction enzyme S subunit